MMALAGDVRQVLAWAVLPAIVSVLLLVVGVEDVRPAPASGRARAPLRWSELGDLEAPFWTVTAVGVVFTLARFSEAFLILRAQNAGLALAWAPAVMVVMNVVYAVASGPAGGLSDRVDRRLLLLGGIAVLVAADVVLALSGSIAGVFAGVALWGLHMGLTQGVLAALVADTAPERLRGTAFGIFNLASGVALLAASAVAGELWTLHGPRWTFLAGAGFSLLAALGLAFVIRRPRAETA
jgi:MFS family permease